MAVLIIGWILLSANPNRITTSAQILSSTPLLEGNELCPGQTVNFTCQTRGALAWSSAEYFGIGGRQLIFGYDDREGSVIESIINSKAHAVLIHVSGTETDYNVTSELRITASLSSSVMCIATDYANQNSAIYLRVIDKPTVPEDPVAIQIRHNRYERCFIPIMWRNTANSFDARVTNYTLYVNGNFISTKTANLSSTVYYSKLLETECADSHIISISANNICGMSQRVIYRMGRQEQQCPTDTDTSSCEVTDIPTLKPTTYTLPATIFTRPVGATRPNGNGYSERNCGNVILIFASGVVVATTFILGSL